MAATGVFSNLYLRELPADVTRPNVDATRYLINGEIRKWDGHADAIYSPILDEKGEKIQIGRYAMLSDKVAMEALHAAHKAFDRGSGRWPTMSTRERIQCVLNFMKGLKDHKAEIVNLLMWEICKVLRSFALCVCGLSLTCSLRCLLQKKEDAIKEVDRTIDYVNDTIKELKNMENRSSQFTIDSGVIAQIRRVPLGVALCLGPFNYPFNETYTNLIPALLMGNTVVLKTPRTGCLCHTPTLELFQSCFPAGVVNIIHGAGRDTLPPLMDSGLVDVFAFIGTSKAAVELQKVHPHPNRCDSI